MKKRTRMLLFLVTCCAVLSLPLAAQAADHSISANSCQSVSNYINDFLTYGSSCEDCASTEENASCSNQSKATYSNSQLATLLFNGTSRYGYESLFGSPTANSCNAESDCSANNDSSCTSASCGNSGSCDNNSASQSSNIASPESSCGNSSNLNYGNLLRNYFAMLSERYNAYTSNFGTITETNTNTSQSPVEKPVEKPVEVPIGTSQFAKEVVELVNAERAAEGLSPLTIDPDLTAAAEIRAQEILGTFSHTRPNGSSCFTALDQVGASYRRAGENIALGQTTAKQVVEDWMNSPGHRENIMNSAYSRIGVATAAANRGYGWAQFFAD